MKKNSPEERNSEYRVVFWHGDFVDGIRVHPVYDKTGQIARKITKNISPDKVLKYHFHGGFIHLERKTLIRRLKQASVLICANPWNMDVEDDNMGWHEAEHSLLNILQEIKKENKSLKIFFMAKPHHALADFKAIGEFVKDLHDKVIYDYFLQ